MPRLLAVLTTVLMPALAACLNNPPAVWINPTHPTADSTRDLYDCGVIARQVNAEKYGSDANAPVLGAVVQANETKDCMASRGWQHVRQDWHSTMIVKPGTDTIRFHTVTPPTDTARGNTTTAADTSH